MLVNMWPCPAAEVQETKASLPAVVLAMHYCADEPLAAPCIVQSTVAVFRLTIGGFQSSGVVASTTLPWSRVVRLWGRAEAHGVSKVP